MEVCSYYYVGRISGLAFHYTSLHAPASDFITQCVTIPEGGIFWSSERGQGKT